MPTLLDTIEIKQIAFEWGGVTRVFRTDNLSVFDDIDKEDWPLADGKHGQNVQGIWLYFQISSNYLQRVSPASSTDNDWIDVKKAILSAGTDVTFYPIYSVDPAISYKVLIDQDGRAPLLETNRGLFKPSVVMNVKAESRLDTYPDWLRITRYKP